MRINCRKIGDNRFIFFRQGGPDRHRPPADSMGLEDVKAPEKVEKREENPDEIAKLREGLEKRHAQIARRIRFAEESKLPKCVRIKNGLPRGTEVFMTAQRACNKAKIKLEEIKGKFPDLPKIEVEPKTATDSEAVAVESGLGLSGEKEFKAALSEVGSRTNTVIRRLSATEAEAKEAKAVVDQLLALGLDKKTIQEVFKQYPKETALMVDLLEDFNASSKENFKKIVVEINKNGVVQFVKNVGILRPTGLSSSQIVNGLSLDRVISGAMTVDSLLKFLIDAHKNKIGVNVSIDLLSIIDENKDPFKYLQLIDGSKDIDSQLAKVNFFINLENGLGAQGYNIPLDTETIEGLYAVEKNPDTVLAFFENIKDLTSSLEDKVALFHLEKDPVKAREIFDAVKEDPSIKDALEAREWGLYKQEYPLMRNLTIAKGRLLKSNPGLYPFLAVEAAKFKISDKLARFEPGVDEYAEFANDPSLPIAYKIYENLYPSATRIIIKDVQECLHLARTLYQRGVNLNGSEINEKDGTSVNLADELSNLNNVVATAEGIDLYAGRKVIIVADNEADNASTRFGNIEEGLKNSGAADIMLIRAERDPDLAKKGAEVRKAELESKKKEFLSAIKNTPPPMTICFNGHGDGTGLALGYKSPSSDITAKDLFVAIKERSGKFKGNPDLSKDIYLFASCATHKVAQDLFKMIKRNNDEEDKKPEQDRQKVVTPIVGGAAEHGIKVDIDNSFSDDAFQLDKNKNANLGDFIGADKRPNKKKDMYLYVPDTQGRPTQVS